MDALSFFFGEGVGGGDGVREKGSVRRMRLSPVASFSFEEGGGEKKRGGVGQVEREGSNKTTKIIKKTRTDVTLV